MVQLDILEDTRKDTLTITIADDGCGIPADMLPNITNPFVTSRTTRRVGLGLPLFKDAAEACDGFFSITHSHIDRAPLGNMADTVMTMVMSFGSADLVYKHEYNGSVFECDTREIKAILGEDSLMEDPEILAWIRDYVSEGLVEIMEDKR